MATTLQLDHNVECDRSGIQGTRLLVFAEQGMWLAQLVHKVSVPVVRVVRIFAAHFPYAFIEIVTSCKGIVKIRNLCRMHIYMK